MARIDVLAGDGSAAKVADQEEGEQFVRQKPEEWGLLGMLPPTVIMSGFAQQPASYDHGRFEGTLTIGAGFIRSKDQAPTFENEHVGGTLRKCRNARQGYGIRPLHDISFCLQK